ncbi:MAG: polysaccharide deacetylase family protein [Candidatus Sulfotelmatobacter sp.]
MRFVSPLLKHAVYPTLYRAGLLSRIAPPGGYAVVNYHGVIPEDYSSSDKFLDGNLVQPEIFRKQLQFLKTHYHVIHPEKFRASIEQGEPLPPRSVLVTCDDGLLNTLTGMLPILQSEEVPCLFFVTTASCKNNPSMLWYEELYHSMSIKPLNGLASQLPPDPGAQSSPPESFRSQWWNIVKRASQLDATTRADWMDRVRARSGSTQITMQITSQLASCEKRWRLLQLPELKQIFQSGMTIGAHTRTHPVLALCSDEEARREIHESKLEIERALDRPVWAFAYPFGNPATMGEREFRLARESGFSCAFLNVEHWLTESGGPFALPRTHVTSDMTLAEFAAHLSGFHARLQRAGGN